MAGGRGALFREDGQSGFDLAWGWDSEAGERVVLCIHTRVFNHVTGPRCSSLTRAAGWHLRAVGGVQAVSPKYRINGGLHSGVLAGHPHTPRKPRPGRPNPTRWTTPV